MTALRSKRHTPQAWILRVVAASVTFLAALWIVVTSIPFPRDPSVPTFSIVGSAVIVAGLAAEELIGADVRRRLGF